MRPEWLLWFIFAFGSRAEMNCAEDMPCMPFFNGRDAKVGEYPFVAFIFSRDANPKQTCAGTIATLSRVISTGTCFGGLIETSEKGEHYTIHGGSIYRHNTAETQTRYTSKVTVHPGYREIDKGHFIQDIGVGHLNKPFEESPTLAPFKLPFETEHKYHESWAEMVTGGKTTCSVIGWGFSREDEESVIVKVVEFVPKTTCIWKDDDYLIQMIGKGEECLAAYMRTGLVVNDLVWKKESDFGMPIMCGGVVYGQTKAPYRPTVDTYNFILFWPYMNYFNLNETLNQSEVTTTTDITGGTDDDLPSGCGNEGGSWLIFPLIPLILTMPRID